jgi:hypothetical protein
MKPIETLRKVRHAIRTGYAWPGGYQFQILMNDGCLMCTDCARDNYRLISYATRHDSRDSWAALGAEIYWEGPTENCAHCNREITPEYSED